MTVTQSSLSLTTPTQVWSHLAADRRHRAIRCVAQLAFNVVTADANPSSREVPDEHSQSTTQTAR